ncbi:MAG: hypothetical protein H6598_02990 [Flavobacteriales bacterium]|nr:hypothetical protein [Flavobacteriales bacterium]
MKYYPILAICLTLAGRSYSQTPEEIFPNDKTSQYITEKVLFSEIRDEPTVKKLLKKEGFKKIKNQQNVIRFREEHDDYFNIYWLDINQDSTVSIKIQDIVNNDQNVEIEFFGERNLEKIKEKLLANGIKFEYSKKPNCDCHTIRLNLSNGTSIELTFSKTDLYVIEMSR